MSTDSHTVATPAKAWLVDLDGTLYYPWGVRIAMALQLAAGRFRQTRILRAFRKEHERLREELTEDVPSPFHLQIERTARRFDQNASDIEPIVREWMIRRPGIWLRLFRRQALLAEIEGFRAQGGRTAIVSDYPATEKLGAMQIRDLFDVVVANGEPGGPGRLKPWPDGYLAAAQRLGVPPEECLVLGDRAEVDGLAAERAHMAFRHIR